MSIMVKYDKHQPIVGLLIDCTSIAGEYDFCSEIAVEGQALNAMPE